MQNSGIVELSTRVKKRIYNIIIHQSVFQCKKYWYCEMLFIYMYTSRCSIYLHGHTIWSWDLSVSASLSAWSHKFLECLDQPLYSTKNIKLNIFQFWQLKTAERGCVLNLSCPIKSYQTEMLSFRLDGTLGRYIFCTVILLVLWWLNSCRFYWYLKPTYQHPKWIMKQSLYS